MTSNRFTILFVLGILIATAVQHAWYWPQLPARVATHFGADGQPNDWMSRSAATSLLVSLQLGIPIFFIGISSLIRHLPASLINIPHREYWLSPERRDATLTHMVQMLLVIAVMTTVFLFVSVHLTFLANRDGTAINTPVFGVALGLYLLGVFATVGYSWWLLRLPNDAKP